MKREGIAVAGNILADYVKIIESYPQKGMLSTIESETLAVGGCVSNTAIDIKKLDPSLTVKVFGRVGDDDKGRFVLKQMEKAGLDTSSVAVTDTAPTSYSDVMTVKSTGERTFFHNRGANAQFCPDDVNIDAIGQKMFHIGYIMLLDYFDKADGRGSTPMAKMLEKIRSRGIKTSVDLVSESSGNFRKIASAAFPFCDYVIINEIEACAVAGLVPRTENGELDEINIGKAMREIMDCGVHEKVIVHCPEKGFCLDKSGSFTAVPSRVLPKGFIKGSVGAGDAFCAGSLYALYNGYPDDELLKFANLVAANCLAAPDSVSGVVEKDRLEEVFAK